MAGAWKKHGMPALGWWLIAVGTFRSAFTWSCFFGSASLCSATYSEIPNQQRTDDKRVDVQARHFSLFLWGGPNILVALFERSARTPSSTGLTLCFLCAFNLSSKPVYTATFLSFVYAISYLAVECFVYHTIRAPSLVTFIFIAGISMVWMMLYQWNPDGRRGAIKQP